MSSAYPVEQTGARPSIANSYPNLRPRGQGVVNEALMESIHDQDKRDGGQRVTLPDRGKHVKRVRETIAGTDLTHRAFQRGDDEVDEDLGEVEATARGDDGEVLYGVKSLPDVVRGENKLMAAITPEPLAKVLTNVHHSVEALPRRAIVEVGSLSRTHDVGVKVENRGEPGGQNTVKKLGNLRKEGDGAHTRGVSAR